MAKNRGEQDIEETCKIISNCNLLFEDHDRQRKMKDSFYKVKKRRNEYTNLKKKVGFYQGVTNKLGKTSLDDYRFNQIFDMKRCDDRE